MIEGRVILKNEKGNKWRTGTFGNFNAV